MGRLIVSHLGTTMSITEEVTRPHINDIHSNNNSNNIATTTITIHQVLVTDVVTLGCCQLS